MFDEEEVDVNKECCFNCRWFEDRTSFCRLNPPQVILQYANRIAYPNSAFPKISIPERDWCSYFENIHTLKII